jgi:putative DNA methylase
MLLKTTRDILKKTMKNEIFSIISQSRLIETDSFPFEFLSTIAKRESWRKEIYRPIYHIHKWWAKRLGSIFRGILLGCLLPENSNLKDNFYKKHDFSGTSIFDPFMGSGTTVGEAHKLNLTALGRDINPVACEAVRIALGPLEHHNLKKAFSYLSKTVGQRILKLYQSEDKNGLQCNVLYYFWVKNIFCLHCSTSVDLFSTRIIARNAYPDRKPEVQICCPNCGDIFTALNSNKQVCCTSCGYNFDPSIGLAQGANAICPTCSKSFSIVKSVRISDKPPFHRLYGKLLLTPEGKKLYLPATSEDIYAYQQCSKLLKKELERGAICLPVISLTDGFNTRQAINYNYYYWRDFFNDRQLLALGWLQEAIAGLSDLQSREALLILFSGLLEFNNLFASYKGEGTGAVRHMFSHHILKPERMPIEANVWGTPKSSGSFSNLFKSRLLRAIDYRESPFEVKTKGSGKAYFTSTPFSGLVEKNWPIQGNFKKRGIYLSCGSSDETCLPDKSVDLVVTDPPFFDNVHYSELADFFFAWQSLYPRGFLKNAQTTRHTNEVQDTSADKFASKLCTVFSECYRILKDNGILVFTYHHSRAEGWIALSKAVIDAGFSICNAHPVKSEMSVATPKSQAKEPIQLDIIIVCKKRVRDFRIPLELNKAMDEAVRRAYEKLTRISLIGLKLSRNDRLITIISQFICALGPVDSSSITINALLKYQAELTKASENPKFISDKIMNIMDIEKTFEPQQLPLSF